ncbi:transketolase [Spiractinospora alimapuensis]|uniref:transketolase n=1 Tax=Spiractinospora alimapuensis TaxID=2820884 RepID=UPI001F201272|nr:transketolase [Spiractinospora alimapuensis]QVQ51394.1 transketolase [Spiractinospora alimapuensis]
MTPQAASPAVLSRYADLPTLIGLMTGDEKHQGAATSTLDVLWVLYDRILNVSPDRVDDPQRDRFLLSKGHGPMAYYAVLAAKGFLDLGTLRRWSEFDSPLGQHPDRALVPGVEISSGSLGHGLGLAVGTALGLRAQGLTTTRTAKHTAPEPRVFVLVGDAELDEGSNLEAIQLAGRLELGGLTTIVIDNGSATHGWPGGIASRFTAEGWTAHVVNGRDHDALAHAFTQPHPRQPLVVVAEVERNS